MLLSNRCFACHGPDDAERQGGFRLDHRESFLAEADSGEPPVIPGEPPASELLRRLTTGDDSERMPPSDFGPKFSPDEVEVIRQWILDGAELPQHWSFVAPRRADFPAAKLLADQFENQFPHTPLNDAWLGSAIDRFVLARQLERGLHPSHEAARSELLRRVSLDLTGLPPTPAEIDAFESNSAPDAYARQVDRLLASPAFGEHWARKWLDLARYADSAGYADDPPRTIWAYRDWVIDAHNANMPIDQFAIEQMAGDLLPNASERNLIATAFHRNTTTNSEGGTNDEEFRNAAIVDRVNTTMAVWMGVTMACAQCHTHKYDPFTQEEYFKLFAILNQTADADLKDERPVLELFTGEQLEQKKQWEQRIEELEEQLLTPTEASLAEMRRWQKRLRPTQWQSLKPLAFSAKSQSDFAFSDSATIRVLPSNGNLLSDRYTLELELPPQLESLVALEIESLPDAELNGGAGFSPNGNFVLTEVAGSIVSAEPSGDPSLASRARYVRVDLPGKAKILSLAEVQVFSAGNNVSAQGNASQSSTDFGGDAARAIDGTTDGDYAKNSTTHSALSDDPWWQLDLGSDQAIDKIVIWNRADSGLQSRLDGAVISLRDKDQNTLVEQKLERGPKASEELVFDRSKHLVFSAAHADYEQPGFPAREVLDAGKSSGWAVGGKTQTRHTLALILPEPIELAALRAPQGQAVAEQSDGSAKQGQSKVILRLELGLESGHRNHLLCSFRVRATQDPSAGDWALLTEEMRAAHALPLAERDAAVEQRLAALFTSRIAKATQPIRAELETMRDALAKLKPGTQVPILQEVEKAARRETFVQIRGNYKSLGASVQPGMPAVFHQPDTDTPNRLSLARWIVDRRNPLTARVWMNRMWETLFGLGIVRTSEEFGTQGDRPTHPELLDWLAMELMDNNWDNKRLLRQIVMSQTYCQSSRATPDELLHDKDNIWLARGPRVRLSAEMVRDQALAVSDLLSRTMHGPPVRPPQPNMGLKAAFGSDTDWTTSAGEDRYRRGLYTTWRRSNPYPSMATFDAPSREVCVLRRDSTNTPLQALVTLNDPGFVEAAQALARRMVLTDYPRSDDRARLQAAMRVVTSREAHDYELETLLDLLRSAKSQLSLDTAAAVQLASDPLGSLPAGADPVELAAWTAVCNVLLNLDEVLMKR